MNVLLAEDTDFNAILILQMLKQCGVESQLAKNGLECLNLVQKGKFDLILMDIEMPLMNGYEALERIRNFPDSKINKTPVVALTAHSEEEVLEKIKTKGFNDILQKPFQKIALENLLKLFESYQ